MNTHPYLRAYLAGIFVPTLVLPLILGVFILTRIVLKMPIPVEQVMIFPMAAAPSLFGLWNMFYLASHARTRLPIGVYGAVLPFVIVPAGGMMAYWLGVVQFGASGVVWFQSLPEPYSHVALVFLVGPVAYYLIWKYIVGFLNRVLGIA